MKKILLICLPVLVLAISCQPKKHGPFIVSGKVEHATSLKAYLMEVPFGAKEPVMLDSTTLSAHGTFQLRAYGKDEGLYVVGVQGGPEVLIINDGNNIKLRLDVANYKSYTIEGSDASIYLHSFLNKYDSTFSLLKQAFILTDSLSHKDSANQLSIVKAEKDKHAQVSSNPKTALLNKPAPEIKVKDTAGADISLSSYKGKYVLVDFWASWCKPCRAENPNVVAAYKEFKDKNFTILSISLDSSKTAWKRAIINDDLTWNHGSDLKEWESPLVKSYKFDGIPFNILVDPAGNIIASELTGSSLREKLLEVLK